MDRRIISLGLTRISVRSILRAILFSKNKLSACVATEQQIFVQRWSVNAPQNEVTKNKIQVSSSIDFRT